MTPRQRLLALGIGAFVIAPAIVAPPAPAAVRQIVNTTKATQIVFAAEQAIWRHNLPASRSWRISCNFENVHGTGTGRTGKPTDCTFRAYRHANYVGRILLFHLDVTVTGRRPDIRYEDGSSWQRYDGSRSLYLNPRAPHR